MPDFEAYQAQINAARDAALLLAAEQERRFLEHLAEYAEELVAVARRLYAGPEHRELASAVESLMARLAVALASSTAEGVRLAARQVGEIHAGALAAVLEGSGLGVSSSFAAAPPAAAHAVLTRRELAESFRSLRAGSAASVNSIIQRGLLRRAPVSVVERELRMHIGAPAGLLEGDSQALSDLRRIGYRMVGDLGYEPTRANLLLVRREAGALRDRARLIARTEIMNAEQEAQALACAASPVVRGVRVRLSGRHPHRDVCDAAAEADLFGMGAGVYPSDRVPARFHPRCLCVFLHVLRPEHEWGLPKIPSPAPAVEWSSVGQLYGIPPSQVQSWRRAMRAADTRLPVVQTG